MIVVSSTLVRAASLLFCGLVAFPHAMDLLDMEFGGGQITGVLVRLCLVGSAAFLLGVPLTFLSRSGATVVATFAAMLCVPFYLYLLVPGSLAWSSAPASVGPAADPSLDRWGAVGMFSVAIMTIGHAVTSRRPGQSHPRTPKTG